MRFENFDVVLIGDAASQTMPETLIPITKGSRKVIFLGDHAQPRVTISNLASIADFDISIFEELYTSDRLNASKVMLDIQDSNDPEISNFLSREFYDSKLRSAKVFPLPSCSFPWPAGKRMAFLQCSTPEDIGEASKSNTGQVKLCAEVCDLLQGQITVLTPYAAQRRKLRRAIPGIRLSGSADIIIFVTVRCNPHRDIGIDRRYLTKLSQARAGVIVIGDTATLTAWDSLLNACAEVSIDEKGTSGS
jgi:regulator of nonsense transcripts 1